MIFFKNTVLSRLGDQNDKSLSLQIHFNISGWTLIPSNQEVIDGEETIASLPRNTYKKIAVSPGIHNLRPSYRKLPKVDLKAIKGNTYYVVIGYRPERSWALPLLGDPVVFKLISEDEAEPLLKELKPD